MSAVRNTHWMSWLPVGAFTAVFFWATTNAFLLPAVEPWDVKSHLGSIPEPVMGLGT